MANYRHMMSVDDIAKELNCSKSHAYKLAKSLNQELAAQHKLKRSIKKAGVKDIRVHDLRHSHVAYLINKGIEPLLIKERLGHKDIRITLNTYGHLYPNQS